MTQDEIIEMARQAGLELDDSLAFEPTVIWYLNQEQLVSFAKLIEDAAQQRTWVDLTDEREACAKVCEPQEQHDDPLTAWKIAEAIRARRQE